MIGDALIQNALDNWLWIAVPIAVVFVLSLLQALYPGRRLSRSGMREIDRMDGKTFERFLSKYFEGRGYRVERTDVDGPYDKGADLILVRDGVRTAVQAKRWRQPVKVDAVRAVVASKDSYGCQRAMVVTNSTYTRQAIDQARDCGVELWDRGRLISELMGSRSDAPAETLSHTAPQINNSAYPSDSRMHSPAGIHACETCGKRLTPRERQYCQSHAHRFAGRGYCYHHQRLAR